jgi:hypothetical protein
LRPLDNHIKLQLDSYLSEIERELDADALTIFSPILPGLEGTVRNAIERLTQRKQRVTIILDTVGGVVEVVERIVETVRHVYQEVVVIVPDKAMSAGTILALSADSIMMDYFSCLGPIDPQVEKDGRLVPALSYLNQFERLNAKAVAGTLTTAEFALLNKMDLGELFQFEQARELSVELLIKWLTNFKFKDWAATSTSGLLVTDDMKRQRAREIAAALNDPERWHCHGRPIDKQTLTSELGLLIDDFSTSPQLNRAVRGYGDLLTDYMKRGRLPSFVHSREYF